MLKKITPIITILCAICLFISMLSKNLIFDAIIVLHTIVCGMITLICRYILNKMELKKAKILVGMLLPIEVVFGIPILAYMYTEKGIVMSIFLILFTIAMVTLVIVEMKKQVKKQVVEK